MTKKTDKSMVDRILGNQTPAPDTTVSSAVETMTLNLNIADIQEYDRNPRIYTNPQYETIRESIRERGVLQRLVVTRRPEGKNYILCQGGNTRLRCLNELYKETKDPKFATTICEYRQWTNEIDLLIGHYAENELRGNLNWHERARMNCDFRLLMEESEGKALSEREYVDAARKSGILIHHQRQSLYRYTVDRLGSVLKHQLENGIGRRPVEKIYKFDNACRSIWTSAGFDEMEYDKQFLRELQDLDQSYKFEILFIEFVPRIASKLKILPSYLERRIEDYMEHGGELPTVDDLKPPARTTDESNLTPSAESGFGASTAFNSESFAPPEGVTLVLNSGPSERTRRRPATPLPYQNTLGERRKAQRKAANLRGKIQHVAELFARSTGNADCIIKIRRGYGIAVLKAPPALPSATHEIQQSVRDQAWWHLFELSGLDQVIQQSPKGISNFARHNDSNIQEYFDSGGKIEKLVEATRRQGMRPPQPGNCISVMIAKLDQSAMTNWLSLIKHYRELSAHFNWSKLKPWEDEESYD